MHISTMFQAKILKALILVLVLYFGIATMPSQAENILFSKDFNGKTITSIKIEVVPIFEGESLSVPYSTANSLKISTKTETIKRELLFEEGDKFDSFLMSEALRRIRAIKYLRKVSITPIPNQAGVDILVSVQDTWTLIPQLSFSSGSGTNSKSIGFSESDLFGLGKRAELSYIEKESNEILESVYEDNRVLGGPTRLVTGFFHRSDGQETILYYGLPFRTLLDPLSWSGTFDDNEFVGRLWENGSTNYIFRQHSKNILARYKIARNDAESDVKRYTIGYDYQESIFLQAREQDYQDLDLDPATVSNDLADLPVNHKFSGPNFAYEFIEPKFISMNYIDRFERIEDYNLGMKEDIGFTIAPQAFGSDDDALLFTLNHSQGYAFSAASFIRGELGMAGRVESQGLQNTLSRADVKFYNVLGDSCLGDLWLGRHTLAVNFSTEIGHDLDLDRQLSLGADNGLRGFVAKSFNGDKRLLFNIEDRVHITENVMEIMSFGVASFIDVGGATYDNYGSLLTDELNADVGAGLRFAFPRSSGGRVLRVDLAAPLNDGSDGSRSLELRIIFAGGQIFGSNLRSESEGSEAANVSVGFER